MKNKYLWHNLLYALIFRKVYVLLFRKLYVLIFIKVYVLLCVLWTWHLKVQIIFFNSVRHAGKCSTHPITTAWVIQIGRQSGNHESKSGSCVANSFLLFMMGLGTGDYANCCWIFILFKFVNRWLSVYKQLDTFKIFSFRNRI